MSGAARDMRAIAARSRRMLAPQARARLIRFLDAQTAPGGGCVDRAGHADLYYTHFAAAAREALGAPPLGAADAAFVVACHDRQGLDFAHTCCLARCRRWLPSGSPCADARATQALASRLEAFRTPDGGYSHESRWREATAYGVFLAVLAYEDLGTALPDAPRAAAVLDRLRTPDGGYANRAAAIAGVTPATAAALVARQALGLPLVPVSADWLLAQVDRDGGFPAHATAFAPDLLSTATALFALARFGRSLDDASADACLQFVSGLWLENGGFSGHELDDRADSEYTFYALLALGALDAMRTFPRS